MDRENQDTLSQIKQVHQEVNAKFEGKLNVSEFEPSAETLETFDKEIPPREYLFYEDEVLGIKKGFLPKGVTCILGAPGGCGKTYMLMQAAIAGACGQKWLHAKPKAPFKVLFLAAEEEQEEMDRRAQAVAKSMGLFSNPKLLLLAKKNLRMFGRLGKDERLMTKESAPTKTFEKLKFFIEQNPDIKLLILDPAADYFAGEEEKDASMAKDFTKLLSKITLTPGRPSILVAHHTRKDSDNSKIFKASEKDKAPDLSIDNVRGSGSIVYSFRWGAVLARRQYDDGTERVFLKIDKSNYTARSRILQFEPDKENGGILKFKSSQENELNKQINDLEKKYQDHNEVKNFIASTPNDINEESEIDSILSNGDY